MNNLEIKQEIRGEEVVLLCSGRLDANWAGYLNDYIDRLVREGYYHLSLDLTAIEYLSSAGIRSLVQQYKNLKSVNGWLYIMAMSENVTQVLSMVGMDKMLSQQPGEVKPSFEKQQSKALVKKEGTTLEIISSEGKAKKTAIFYGNPGLVLQSGYTEKDARLIQSKENHFAFGLGAIGQSFGECKNRFGEYLMLGKSVAYLPADGSGKPDYMVSSGKLVASMTELYGIHFDGDFSHLIRFEQVEHDTTTGISQLAEGISELTGLTRFAMVMVAESGGLIGVSLNVPPIEGRKIFSFPEIKEAVNFTAEPVYNKMLSLSVGYFSSERKEEAGKFLRPMQPGKSMKAHIHAAVFPFVPLKKTDINLGETIDFLFNNSELTDILHLTNDTREIVGLGESQFVNGFCWITPAESKIEKTK